MSYASPAIAGAVYAKARSFKVAFTTSAAGSATASAAGSYEITATQDCEFRLSNASNAVAAALPTSQPALGSENGTIRLVANAGKPLDIPPTGSWYVSAIGLSASGDVAISGPILHGSNR